MLLNPVDLPSITRAPRWYRGHRCAVVALALVLPGQLYANPSPAAMPLPQILDVGPGLPLPVPSAAARIARDGATVNIAAGDYAGDVAVWTQDRLTIRGVGGGVGDRARIQAAGQSAEGKAIWVIRGDLVLVEHVEFSGARVRGHNGAGIRAEGGRLTLRDCRLHHNEMGILTYNERQGELTIEDSEVDDNATDTEIHGKLGHGIYAGRIGRFTLRHSTVRNSHIGHLVKSRAAVNLIEDNLLVDGPVANQAASYLIDLPEAGAAWVVRNRLEKSAAAPNRTAISYGAEFKPGDQGPATAGRSLLVERNDYRVSGSPGIFVHNHLSVPVRLLRNRIPEDVTPLLGPGVVQ
jgi:hypothetical protein